jgi:hypothetical protein
VLEERIVEQRKPTESPIRASKNVTNLCVPDLGFLTTGYSCFFRVRSHVFNHGVVLFRIPSRTEISWRIQR